MNNYNFIELILIPLIYKREIVKCLLLSALFFVVKLKIIRIENNHDNHILRKNKFFNYNNETINSIDFIRDKSNINNISGNEKAETEQELNVKISNTDSKMNTNKKRIIKDVLLINGYDINLNSQSYRYRVLNQIEQLNTGSFEYDELFYLNLESSMVLNYRFFIFFHCPWTEKIEQSILLAKSLNKKVLFDIDDLIFDTKYTDQIQCIKNLNINEKKIYDEEVIKIGRTLKLCDSVITTTETIANELTNYLNNVFINRNVASEEMWKLSQDALIKKINKTNNENIIISYFSDSITCSSDLYILEPVLRKILSEFKNVKLLFLGGTKISNFLIDFSERIVQQNYTDWRELPEIISNVDINIVPLEKNIFNEGKSENKWLESSLVKVPTIASNLGAFQQVIIHNETGLLCSDMNEWYISLKELISNEHLRKIIGENAYNFDLSTYQKDLEELIKYVKGKAPNAQIIIIDDFWFNNISAYRKAAASACGVDFVDLSVARADSSYQCGMGSTIYDNSGNAHTVNHGGLATHPGDKGHAYIAEGIINYLK